MIIKQSIDIHFDVSYIFKSSHCYFESGRISIHILRFIETFFKLCTLIHMWLICKILKMPFRSLVPGPCLQQHSQGICVEISVWTNCISEWIAHADHQKARILKNCWQRQLLAPTKTKRHECKYHGLLENGRLEHKPFYKRLNPVMLVVGRTAKACSTNR